MSLGGLVTTVTVVGVGVREGVGVLLGTIVLVAVCDGPGLGV